MIAVVWHVVGIVFSLCILFVIAVVVVCAVGDWRRDRARRAEQRAADVRLARSRQVPASLGDDARPEYHDEFGRSTDPNACGCAHCNLVVLFIRSLMQPAAWDAGLAELHGETA